MIVPQLALKNIVRAGLRTWLNVVVISLAIVSVIFLQGINQGVVGQVSRAMVDEEIGGGQYWQAGYDPYDPLTLSDAHAPMPGEIGRWIEEGRATPIIVVQGTIYPGGRIRPVLLKGIDPGQGILKIPSRFLEEEEEGSIPVLIGSRMARSAGLEVGDYVTVRWRDAGGTFDAREARVAQIMATTAPGIDHGQLWVPLARLREMAGMEDEATLVVVVRDFGIAPELAGWQFRDLGFLLKDIRDIVRIRTIASSFLYLILLSLGLLAVFDTQVLAIFRRRREIGTLVALGMTRGKVIQLFTVEGGLHGLLAVLVAGLYGVPLCAYYGEHGIPLPSTTDSMGLALGTVLYPDFSAWLIGSTVGIVLVAVVVVSWLPARRIARLRPTDALQGRIR